jgi:hypothetical protein
MLATALLAATTLGATLGHGTPPGNNETVANRMQQLAGDVQLLMPLMYRAENALNQNEMQTVLQTIGNMRSHLSAVEGTLTPRSDTYQTSFKILTQQLDQAQQELTAGRVDYGMDLLQSATSACASCHTQDDRSAKWLAPTSRAMADPFVAGEYFFMTRQYERSFSAFEQWLNNLPSLPYDKQTLTAFQRLLLTGLQMRKSPADLKQLMESYIHRDNINLMLRTHLVAWRDGLGELQSLVDVRSHPDTKTLRRFAEEWLNTSKNQKLAHVYLPENSRPKIVWLRGELYRALTNETDSNATPEWLYWLAVSDRLLEYRFFYSLADMYLKQCILDYSNADMARRCYGEYENYVEFYYSGSGGTFIPEDVQSELQALKAKVAEK